MEILFIGKKHNNSCKQASEFLKLHRPNSNLVFLEKNERLDKDLRWFEYDYIISYLCPYVIPNFILEKTSIANINFHPGPPEYPGIGCTNFAVYNAEKVFGVTCHHMSPAVDTGEIITIERFPLYQTDTVFSLTERCYSYLLTMFYNIMTLILADKPLPLSDEIWQRKPYTRIELDALCKIEGDMTVDEVKRRVKAVTFPGKLGAYIEMHGIKYEKKEES